MIVNFRLQLLLSLIATIWLTPQILAAPLESYCISKVAQKQQPNSPTFKAPHPFKKKQTRLNIPVQGKKSLSVVVSGVDNLLLMDENDPKPLAKVEATQYEGYIEDLVLSKDGWLWIDGTEIDYMARLEFPQMGPTLTQPVAVPELYEKPCSFWHRFWLECKRVQGFYSSVLERAFITGHRPTLFGWADLVSLEMVAGETKLLPDRARGARFLADVPKLNGILLRGASEEALFYDGVTITTLLSGSRKQRESTALARWHVKHVKSLDTAERTFLTNIGHGQSPPFLMELKAGATLMPISLPEELGKTWLSLFTLSKGTQLWGVTRHNILAEVEGRLETVAVVSAPSFIAGPTKIWQAENGAMGFVVKNPITDSSANYFLLPASSPHKCQVPLNADEPISLSKE